MAQITPFVIPDLTAVNPDDPTEQELGDWRNALINVINGLVNLVTVFNLTTPTIPPPGGLGPGAAGPIRRNYAQALTQTRNQVILNQSLILAEVRVVMNRRTAVKVQRPSFDGKTENTRGFLAGLATYRHLRGGDFANDEMFIAWALTC